MFRRCAHTSVITSSGIWWEEVPVNTLVPQAPSYKTSRVLNWAYSGTWKTKPTREDCKNPAEGTRHSTGLVEPLNPINECHDRETRFTMDQILNQSLSCHKYSWGMDFRVLSPPCNRQTGRFWVWLWNLVSFRWLPSRSLRIYGSLRLFVERYCRRSFWELPFSTFVWIVSFS